MLFKDLFQGMVCMCHSIWRSEGSFGRVGYLHLRHQAQQPLPAESSPWPWIFSYCLPAYVVTIAGDFFWGGGNCDRVSHFPEASLEILGLRRPPAMASMHKNYSCACPVIPFFHFQLIFLSQDTEHCVFCLILLLFILKSMMQKVCIGEESSQAK